MKDQVRAILCGVTISLASESVGHAMSELISVSSTPVWPATSSPNGTLVYNITTVGRGGSGLLEVTLSAGAMPPGVTVTFSPSVLRFTGNQLSSQTATMTVTCPIPTPIDSYPFTLTGTALRQTITVTNQVLYSADYLANRLPTLMLDRQTNGVWRVRGLGATGKTYAIQVTTTLANPAWTNLGSTTADGNGRFTFLPAEPTNAPTRFFRAVVATP
jgi:hypothetical protein